MVHIDLMELVSLNHYTDMCFKEDQGFKKHLIEIERLQLLLNETFFEFTSVYATMRNTHDYILLNLKKDITH